MLIELIVNSTGFMRLFISWPLSLEYPAQGYKRDKVPRSIILSNSDQATFSPLLPFLLSISTIHLSLSLSRVCACLCTCVSLSIYIYTYFLLSILYSSLYCHSQLSTLLYSLLLLPTFTSASHLACQRPLQYQVLPLLS